MSAAAALLETIVQTRVRLSSVTRVRIALSKKPGAGGMKTRASISEFMKRRLPILKFHNEQLQVSIFRPLKAGSVGIDVQRGSQWYTLPHAKATDDVLMEQIIAIDRGEIPAEVVAGEGVKEEVDTAAAAKPAEKAATPAAAAADKPASA